MDTTTFHSPSAAEHPSGASPLPRPLLVSIMIALLLTAFLEALDNLIVTPALPRIASGLYGFDRYAWVVTTYLLAATAAVPLAGKLSDQFGRKGFLLAGISVFLLGSGLAGAAQTMDQLIIFRAIQGLGTGMGIGLVAAVVGDLFPPEQRASKQGLLGIVFGISQLCGPTLGGWITDHGPLVSGFVTETTRWRWLFYLNLPIGLLALIVLAIFLPASPARQDRRTSRRSALLRVDWLGAGLLVIATCSLLLGLSLGSAAVGGWTQPMVIALVMGAVVLYGLFLLVERKAAEPIIPLALFRNRAFAIDALQTLIQGMILIGVFLPLSLLLQGVLTLSPTQAGALITALSISLTIGAALAGMSISLLKRCQPTVIAGATILTVGVVLLMFMGTTSNFVLIGLALVLIGLGAGSFFTIQMIVAQNAIPLSHIGVGIGVIRYLGQLGMTLGSALMGLIMNGALAGKMDASLSMTSTAQAQLSGVLHNGFVLVLALSIVLLLTSLFLKDIPSLHQVEQKV